MGGGGGGYPGIQTLRWGERGGRRGGRGGRAVVGRGGSLKYLFSALQASVWSKSKEGRASSWIRHWDILPQSQAFPPICSYQAQIVPFEGLLIGGYTSSVSLLTRRSELKTGQRDS